MTILEEIKLQKIITRDDIERLLKSIGKSGEKHQEKIDAVKQLNKSNGQAVRLEQTIEGYRNW